MNKTIFTILLLAITSSLLAQNISIDVVTYGNAENIEYSLEEIVQRFIANNNNECVSYTKVANVKEGNSDIILELWDSAEFLSQYIFKEGRTKRVKDKEGNYSNQKFTATGLNVRSQYEIYGRLFERADGNVLETFKMGGTYDYEIPSDQIRNKYPYKQSDYKKVNDMFLEQYSDDIAARREAAKAEIDSTLTKAVLAVSTPLLPPARLTSIAKEKKDELKKANYEKCDGVEIKGGGLFYTPVLMAENIGEETVYRKVGSCFQDFDPKVMSIKGGAKELLPLMKSDAQLYIGKATDMEPSALSKYKDAKTKNLSFVFMYQPTHQYNEGEQKYIELLCQSSFLGYDDVKVVAHDPVTEEINKTYAQSIFDRLTDKKEKEESLLDNLSIGDMKSNGTIYVEIGNAKDSPLEGKTSFLGQKIDAEPGTRYLFMRLKYKDEDDKVYEDELVLSGVGRKIGLDFEATSLPVPNVREAIADTKIQILGIEEEKKDKVKKVIVAGNIPLDGGDKYKVYDKPNYGKKTKALAELSIDDLLNDYVATAKVKKGDKDIKALINSGKELYIDMSKVSNLPRKGVVVIEAEGDRIVD